MTLSRPAEPGSAGPVTAQERRALAWLLLVALVVLGAGIGLRDPWPSDEPRFTLVAKHMVASGDWLFPHRGIELYADKPPMLMWLEALAYQVTGHWRVAFLLPSLLAGLFTLLLTWDIGRRLWNPTVGLLAAGALLASIQFCYQVKRAQIDPLVMAYVTLANWGLIIHLLRGPNWRAWCLGCFAAGLGVITKGVGVIALLMLLPYALARSKGWPGVSVTSASKGKWVLGVVCFLGAIALWLVPMLLVAQARGGAAYMDYVHDILLRQTARRYEGSVGGHAQPFWYYLPVLIVHFFPLSLLYVSAWRRWRDGWRTRDARYLLLLGWCLLVLLFFSLAGGKREVYLMPILPLLALALAPTLREVLHARWLARVAFGCALAGGLVLLGWGAGVLMGRLPNMTRMATEMELAEGGRWLWLMLLAMGGALLAGAAIARPRRGVHGLLGGLAGVWVLWGVWGGPLLNDTSSARGVMTRAGQIAGPTAEIGLVAWKEQNLLMADRLVSNFGFKRPWPRQFADAVAWQRAAPAGQERWIFALADAVTPCVRRDRASVAGYANRRVWLMFRADAVVEGCTASPAEGVARWDSRYADDDRD